MSQDIKYIRTVKPTTEEKKRGAEVVFVYTYMRKKVRVLGATCHGSWEQWGAPTEALGANVTRIEEWRKSLDKK